MENSAPVWPVPTEDQQPSMVRDLNSRLRRVAGRRLPGVGSTGTGSAQAPSAEGGFAGGARQRAPTHATWRDAAGLGVVGWLVGKCMVSLRQSEACLDESSVFPLDSMRNNYGLPYAVLGLRRLHTEDRMKEV